LLRIDDTQLTMHVLLLLVELEFNEGMTFSCLTVDSLNEHIYNPLVKTVKIL